MMGTINCIYETPCGWCSKWDKKCDRKIYCKDNDIIDDKSKEHWESALLNNVCKQESDHEWECYGISTLGTLYICKKCSSKKTTVFEHVKDEEVRI